ncbi:hypothetical protein IFR04_008093 [Cadophora malorum]|uniref:Carboxylesterase type B domain-containing protein n=1 Tax=Cadophora malorum TaxID=108018 RepID=A0A8H7TGY9_9HELO|nr:hypothetical protein IFR04_008093 [Cadophora malorum]
MWSQSLGLVTLSKYNDFIYPPRANAQALKDNQVDLDYEILEGKVENDTLLAFRNIPYAEPPLDILRWYEALEPQTIREQVNEGSIDHKYPQEQVEGDPLILVFLGLVALEAAWVSSVQDVQANSPKVVCRGSGAMRLTPKIMAQCRSQFHAHTRFPTIDEDCLILDAMVPTTVWENEASSSAAVIFWLYGGGFVYGWKDLLGSPAGLFKAAEGN